jgi:starch synthase
MSKSKILFVTQEITPFLSETTLAETVRNISQGVHELDKEIRIFMPRFGVINERRHQLHEVIRLSGMNIIVDDADHPLIIKVASIPQARVQVYFIDNDEFFRRKRIFRDENEKYFKDNDDRSIFFSRGVVETVKKLGWAPDIVHCNGWLTSLLPLYLKTYYKNEPYFEKAKIIYSIYNNGFKGSLSKDILSKLNFDEIDTDTLNLPKAPNSDDMNKVGISWADAVTIGTETINEEIRSYIVDSGKPMLTYQENDNLVEAHQDFYNRLMTLDKVLSE